MAQLRGVDRASVLKRLMISDDDDDMMGCYANQILSRLAIV